MDLLNAHSQHLHRHAFHRETELLVQPLRVPTVLLHEPAQPLLEKPKVAREASFPKIKARAKETTE